MEHAKLANGNGHEARIGGSASSTQPDEHAEVGRQAGGPEEDPLEKS